MQETWVQSLGWEDPLEKEATYPLQYSGLENSMDCIVQGGHKESGTTEWLSLSPSDDYSTVLVLGKQQNDKVIHIYSLYNSFPL